MQRPTAAVAEVRETASAEFCSTDDSGGGKFYAAATAQFGPTTPNLSIVQGVHETTIDPASHFINSVQIAHPYAAHIERHTRRETPVPLSTIMAMEDLTRELDIFEALSEEPPHRQTMESMFVRSSQSYSDEEEDHSPAITDGSTSRGKHIWTIRYPSNGQYINQLLRDAQAMRLASLVRNDALHQPSPVEAAVNADGSISVDTKLVKDTRGLLLYEITTRLPFRAGEGTDFVCEGALEGVWTVVTIRYYHDGYGYIWCANYPEKDQVLLRLLQQFVYDADADSVHAWCGSFCEQKKTFLSRFK